MALLVAILLAVFYLEGAWDYVAIGAGVALEATETAFLFWWSKRRQAVVGTEALVGRRAIVATDCMPEGQVRVAGELWQARCAAGAAVGDEVLVRTVDGLVLEVEHE